MEALVALAMATVAIILPRPRWFSVCTLVPARSPAKEDAVIADDQTCDTLVATLDRRVAPPVSPGAVDLLLCCTDFDVTVVLIIRRRVAQRMVLGKVEVVADVDGSEPQREALGVCTSVAVGRFRVCERPSGLLGQFLEDAFGDVVGIAFVTQSAHGRFGVVPAHVDIRGDAQSEDGEDGRNEHDTQHVEHHQPPDDSTPQRFGLDLSFADIDQPTAFPLHGASLLLFCCVNSLFFLQILTEFMSDRARPPDPCARVVDETRCMEEVVAVAAWWVCHGRTRARRWRMHLPDLH